MMSLKLWLTLSALWILIVGGGLLAVHWIDTGQVDVPFYRAESLDDADVFGDGDCDRYYRERPEQDRRLSSDPHDLTTASDRCHAIHWLKGRGWRIHLAVFLALVFGPPILLGVSRWILFSERKGG